MPTVAAGHRSLDLLRDLDTPTPTVEAWALETLGTTAPSVQLAVLRHGQVVCSLAAGEDHAGRPITRDSVHLLYSSTKLTTALVMALLADRGYFDWDDAVAAHWPEFAANGKAEVTIRQVVSHRAGLDPEPAMTSWPWWGDQRETGRMMAALGLKWEPGSAGGYHNRTFGKVLDHLVWRITGKGTDSWIAEAVTGPAEIDGFFCGVSREIYDTRFVKTTYPGLPATPARAGSGASGAGASGRGPGGADDEFRTPIKGENAFNSWEFARRWLAWGSASATAEAAADVAGFWAGGGRHRSLRLFSPATLVAVTTPQNPEGEVDATLKSPVRWGLGVQVSMFDGLAGLEQVIGHGGGATIQVWADPATGISVACCLGGLRLAGLRAAGGDGMTRAGWQRGLAEAIHTDLYTSA